jgi:hypothetical protein
MTCEEETAIRAWLAHIEETDADIIAEVLNQCRADAEARAYFLRRADEVTRPVPDDDDRRHCAQCANQKRMPFMRGSPRRHCAQCANLAPSGLCLAARRGEIIASRTYHPVDHLPRRCEGYVPGADDPDRRPGRERWPGLTMKGGNNGT